MKSKLYQGSFREKLRKFVGLYRNPNLDADKLRPEEFTGDYSLLNLVHGSEASVSTKDSLRPVLATVGMGPCIAMSGYDSKQRIGFLSHNSNEKHVDFLHDLVLDELNKLLKSELDMDIYIVGGMIGSRGLAKKLSENAKKFNPKTINYDLALNISEWTYLGKSFVLDTRDGKVYSIDGGGKLQYCPPAEPLISLRKQS